jgi:hypothetical protein
MMKRILGIAVALAVPALLAAQTSIPANEQHASGTAKAKSIPAAQASDTARSKVAQAMARRATRVRGQAVGLDNRPVTPVTPATPASRATPAQPGEGVGGRAIPATPATPATPASPSQKPADPGAGHGRRP